MTETPSSAVAGELTSPRTRTTGRSIRLPWAGDVMRIVGPSIAERLKFTAAVAPIATVMPIRVCAWCPPVATRTS